MHLYIGCTDVLEISLCVIFQVVGDTEPGGEMRRMRQWIWSRSLMWSQQCEFCKAWRIWRSLTIVLSSFPLSSFLEWCQPLCGLCPLRRRPLWGSRPAGCSAESLHVAIECYKEVNINGLLVMRKYQIFANNQCDAEFTMSLWWNCRCVCEIMTEMPLLNWMKIT